MRGLPASSSAASAARDAGSKAASHLAYADASAGSFVKVSEVIAPPEALALSAPLEKRGLRYRCRHQKRARQQQRELEQHLQQQNSHQR
eukprot:CAMPEP_0113708084 /NCGR_PEP_ID=MMETSP0038_2-20120614/28769_1 /TAXON_ID=2898 /ORGANISM="Cryptomonas paramecium" /LENGTH=88 /DNA_ID=CAMNT_0000633719 /DNA_START=82 /DNA_END=349 /DNA_ORIENTATION=- /assembly_acc=CAM_ASM_000170